MRKTTFRILSVIGLLLLIAACLLINHRSLTTLYEQALGDYPADRPLVLNIQTSAMAERAEIEDEQLKQEILAAMGEITIRPRWFYSDMVRHSYSPERDQPYYFTGIMGEQGFFIRIIDDEYLDLIAQKNIVEDHYRVVDSTAMERIYQALRQAGYVE